MKSIAPAEATAATEATEAAAPPEAWWRASFDGCARPNPGRMGVGAVLLAPDGRRFEISRPAPQSGCNNEAELLALCAVLELALAQGADRLDVVGDSDFVTRHVRGEARTAVVRLLPALAQAAHLLRCFADARLRWLPRHRNLEADTLSRQALGLAPKPPVLKPLRRRGRG